MDDKTTAEHWTAAEERFKWWPEFQNAVPDRTRQRREDFVAGAVWQAEQQRPVLTREQIAQAIHDGPNAQKQYRKAHIAPHTWAECPYQAEYLADADAVLAQGDVLTTGDNRG